MTEREVRLDVACHLLALVAQSHTPHQQRAGLLRAVEVAVGAVGVGPRIVHAAAERPDCRRLLMAQIYDEAQGVR